MIFATVSELPVIGMIESVAGSSESRVPGCGPEDPANANCGLRCDRRQIRRGEKHDLLLGSFQVNLEGAIGPEYIVVLVITEVAAGALLIDLCSRLDERQARRVGVAHSAWGIRHLIHLFIDGVAINGVGFPDSQSQADDTIIGVVLIWELCSG